VVEGIRKKTKEGQRKQRRDNTGVFMKGTRFYFPCGRGVPKQLRKIVIDNLTDKGDEGLSQLLGRAGLKDGSSSQLPR